MRFAKHFISLINSLIEGTNVRFYLSYDTIIILNHVFGIKMIR